MKSFDHVASFFLFFFEETILKYYHLQKKQASIHISSEDAVSSEAWEYCHITDTRQTSVRDVEACSWTANDAKCRTCYENMFEQQ